MRTNTSIVKGTELGKRSVKNSISHWDTEEPYFSLPIIWIYRQALESFTLGFQMCSSYACSSFILSYEFLTGFNNLTKYNVINPGFYMKL